MFSFRELLNFTICRVTNFDILLDNFDQTHCLEEIKTGLNGFPKT